MVRSWVHDLAHTAKSRDGVVGVGIVHNNGCAVHSVGALRLKDPGSAALTFEQVRKLRRWRVIFCSFAEVLRWELGKPELEAGRKTLVLGGGHLPTPRPQAASSSPMPRQGQRDTPRQGVLDANILHLPPHILAWLFRHLTAQELCRLHNTCRALGPSLPPSILHAAWAHALVRDWAVLASLGNPRSVLLQERGYVELAKHLPVKIPLLLSSTGHNVRHHAASRLLAPLQLLSGLEEYRRCLVSSHNEAIPVTRMQPRRALASFAETLQHLDAFLAHALHQQQERRRFLQASPQWQLVPSTAPTPLPEQHDLQPMQPLNEDALRVCTADCLETCFARCWTRRERPAATDPLPAAAAVLPEGLFGAVGDGLPEEPDPDVLANLRAAGVEVDGAVMAEQAAVLRAAALERRADDSGSDSASDVSVEGSSSSDGDHSDSSGASGAESEEEDAGSGVESSASGHSASEDEGAVPVQAPPWAPEEVFRRRSSFKILEVGSASPSGKLPRRRMWTRAVPEVERLTPSQQAEWQARAVGPRATESCAPQVWHMPADGRDASALCLMQGIHSLDPLKSIDVQLFPIDAVRAAWQAMPPGITRGPLGHLHDHLYPTESRVLEARQAALTAAQAVLQRLQGRLQHTLQQEGDVLRVPSVILRNMCQRGTVPFAHRARGISRPSPLEQAHLGRHNQTEGSPKKLYADGVEHLRKAKRIIHEAAYEDTNSEDSFVCLPRVCLPCAQLWSSTAMQVSLIVGLLVVLLVLAMWNGVACTVAREARILPESSGNLGRAIAQVFVIDIPFFITDACFFSLWGIALFQLVQLRGVDDATSQTLMTTAGVAWAFRAIFTLDALLAELWPGSLVSPITFVSGTYIEATPPALHMSGEQRSVPWLPLPRLPGVRLFMEDWIPTHSTMPRDAALLLVRATHGEWWDPTTMLSPGQFLVYTTRRSIALAIVFFLSGLLVALARENEPWTPLGRCCLHPGRPHEARRRCIVALHWCCGAVRMLLSPLLLVSTLFIEPVAFMLRSTFAWTGWVLHEAWMWVTSLHYTPPSLLATGEIAALYISQAEFVSLADASVRRMLDATVSDEFFRGGAPEVRLRDVLAEAVTFTLPNEHGPQPLRAARKHFLAVWSMSTECIQSLMKSSLAVATLASTTALMLGAAGPPDQLLQAGAALVSSQVSHAVANFPSPSTPWHFVLLGAGTVALCAVLAKTLSAIRGWASPSLALAAWLRRGNTPATQPVQQGGVEAEKDLAFIVSRAQGGLASESLDELQTCTRDPLGPQQVSGVAVPLVAAAKRWRSPEDRRPLDAHKVLEAALGEMRLVRQVLPLAAVGQIATCVCCWVVLIVFALTVPFPQSTHEISADVALAGWTGSAPRKQWQRDAEVQVHQQWRAMVHWLDPLALVDDVAVKPWVAEDFAWWQLPTSPLTIAHWAPASVLPMPLREASQRGPGAAMKEGWADIFFNHSRPMAVSWRSFGRSYSGHLHRRWDGQHVQPPMCDGKASLAFKKLRQQGTAHHQESTFSRSSVYHRHVQHGGKLELLAPPKRDAVCAYPPTGRVMPHVAYKSAWYIQNHRQTCPELLGHLYSAQPAMHGANTAVLTKWAGLNTLLVALSASLPLAIFIVLPLCLGLCEWSVRDPSSLDFERFRSSTLRQEVPCTEALCTGQVAAMCTAGLCTTSLGVWVIQLATMHTLIAAAMLEFLRLQEVALMPVFLLVCALGGAAAAMVEEAVQERMRRWNWPEWAHDAGTLGLVALVAGCISTTGTLTMAHIASVNRCESAIASGATYHHPLAYICRAGRSEGQSAWIPDALAAAVPEAAALWLPHQEAVGMLQTHGSVAAAVQAKTPTWLLVMVSSVKVVRRVCGSTLLIATLLWAGMVVLYLRRGAPRGLARQRVT